MARPYNSPGGGFGGYHSPSYRNHRFPDHSTSPLDDFGALVSQTLRSLARFWRERGRHMALAAVLSAAHRLRQNLAYRRLFSFPHLLVVVWVLVLFWGERWAFRSKVGSCRWSNWENWV